VRQNLKSRGRITTKGKRNMTPLCELARKFETDKGGQHFRYGGGDSDTNHNYTVHYHEMFKGVREEVRHVLEIGINAGSSLRMWKAYFPKAQIVGLDSDAKCLVHNAPRIKCLAADQGSRDSLYAALAQLDPDLPKFDLIVDDGSHERNHQITSLKTLLPFLANHGYYVIEDLGTAPMVPEFYNGEAVIRPLDGASLIDAVPIGYSWEFIKVTGGLGPKVQPHEWLAVIRHE
jgi:cephalosporin hydroxylase